MSKQRDNCSACGAGGDVEVHYHHLIPRAYGGERGPTAPLCPNCHDLVHKVADNPKLLAAIEDRDTRFRIEKLADIARRAERLVKSDPNRSVVFHDRMPADLARKVADLASLHNCAKKEAIRIAIRNEHARWFGHRRAMRA